MGIIVKSLKKFRNNMLIILRRVISGGIMYEPKVPFSTYKDTQDGMKEVDVDTAKQLVIERTGEFPSWR
jgi:hypothetical protein